MIGTFYMCTVWPFVKPYDITCLIDSITVEGVVPPNKEYCVLFVVGGAGDGGGRGDPDENPKISIPGTAEVDSGGKIPPWLTRFPLFIPSTLVVLWRGLLYLSDAVVWEERAENI